ncbi:MAG: hypothetical protein ACYTGZ_14370 [Planctomycetota bacterium]|jgi:predicted Rossmann fold nucleotide-binding protein DprA/Smf involved in DNA uptake
MHEHAPWLALAFRSGMSDADKRACALGDGPQPWDFPEDVLERESEDAAALEDMGVRLLTLADPDYPSRLLMAMGPVVLQVAGRADLVDEENVAFIPGSGAKGRQAIQEHLESGDRAVVVLSKGMLKAKSMLRALHEPIDNGTIALVSAEPPRAAWGPVRDANRDLLLAALQG